MTLSSVEPGRSVTVTKLHENGAVRRRIMDMGITKGTQLTITRVAPVGVLAVARCAQGDACGGARCC